MNRQPSSFFPSKYDDVAEEQGYLRYVIEKNPNTVCDAHSYEQTVHP